MGVLTFVCNIGSSLFLLYEIMLLATLMSKNVPLEGKGMLIGLYSWAGSVGVLVVSKCGGALYDINKNLTWTYAGCYSSSITAKSRGYCTRRAIRQTAEIPSSR